MGEVYRARDPKLHRDVAIKVLPAAFADDPGRLARFQREAHVLASLNHPHIAAIYGLEEPAGTAPGFLVMELVEGEDLSQRIERGALPLDEALPIARQIAAALEAAHEQGIIHRDLKPANVKVRPDGTVKVLDFGLAKAMEPAGSAANVSQSPTITTPAMMTRLRQGYGEAGTAVGMLLGTPAYMSPEQAKGRAADKRSDIWAFGCVLYEMLTGRRAFPGDDVGDTLASVLKSEPDWNALPPANPSTIRTLLRRCLTKDRTRRLDSAADARLEIDEALTMPAPDLRAFPAGRAGVGWPCVAMAMLAALVAGGAATGATVWFATRPAPLPLVRTVIPMTGIPVPTVITAGPHLTLTPDGSRVVYTGGGQILVRALDQLEPTALTGMDAPQGLFTSPDGRWVGFFDRALKKVAITGGVPVTVASTDAPARGATWGVDDTIVFATAGSSGLQRVPASSGAVTVLTTPDRARGEVDHVWPEFMPDARAVLYTITAVTGGLDAAQIAVLDLRTGKQTVLLRGGSHARYVSSGHLVYGSGGGLSAVAFDLDRLAVVGAPVPIVASVATTPSGSIEANVARNGTLVFFPGDMFAALAGRRTLVWVDRQGQEEPLGAPARAYLHPRLAPDGTRVAVSSLDQELDLSVWDLARATLTRLTFEPATDHNAIWTPDSKRLIFTSTRAGQSNLYVLPADNTGSATRLIDSPNPQFATGITSDGTRVIVYEATRDGSGRDLLLLTLTATPRIEPLLKTRFDERSGVVSPDGRWLAYVSNRSSRFEIYVQPFPTVGDVGLRQVSTAGGEQPLWASSGRELLYLAPDGALMGVSVESSGTTWSAGTSARLLEGRYFTGGGNVGRSYDVTADGKRFLMIKEDPSDAGSSAQIIVWQNWFEELKRLVPVK